MTKLEKSMVESMGLTEDNFNKPKVTEIDRIKANVDFLAMLNGVELEVSAMSKNYAKVKRYYDSRLWSVAMVHTAVGKWITAEEYTTITGQTYESEEQ